MKNPAFEAAARAMAALELYREHFASNEEYQRRLQDVKEILQVKARAMTNLHDKKFLLGFAETLEQANISGDYQDRHGGLHP